MSTVPGEVLRDVLLPLDRWTLDGVQFTNRRFLRLIMERMSHVCLRQVYLATFQAPVECPNRDGSLFIQIDDQPERKISMAHKNTARLFSKFVQALRSSRVAFLTLNELVFTPDLAALVLQTPVVTDVLSLVKADCAQLTTSQFHEVVVQFSPTTLDLNTCHLRACQVTDGFLRALSKNRVRRIKLQNMAPVDGGSFGVTDDAVVEFCVQEDVPIDQEGDAAPERKLYGELVVSNGSTTKGLFKRLIEASSASMRSKPLRIVVSPSRVEDEDLREFAQHLSYRQRGQPRQLRIYDFPGEQHDAMHLQIALFQNNRLEMIRARRINPFFYESDE